ncbi:MAG TPA: YciI family protein [Solirubrobacterales bacterium]|nr:YciI family protein [Solirubrobacterales bacterium]
MAEYLLSTHTVAGEEREPMSEERMHELMRKIGELEHEMTESGALVYSGRLADVETARVVRFAGGKTLTTDGPFAETKEQLGGFYIISADDLDEALAWASKTSECIDRPIEVRPFFAARAG